MADSIKFAGADRATAGDWAKAFGTEGYQFAGGPTRLPPGAAVAFTGQTDGVWTTQPWDDARCLKKPDGSGRLAACWYGDAGRSFALDVTVAAPTVVTLYFVDYDNAAGGRRQHVRVFDAAGALIDTKPVEAFAWGAYLSYAVTGTARFKFVNDNPGANAVLSGVFFGAVAAPAPAPASGPIVLDGVQGWGVFGASDLAEIEPGNFVYRDAPASADLSPTMPAFKSQQGQNASAAMAVAALLQSYDPSVVPSALFIHYNATALDGKAGQKVGSTNVAACMAVVEFGYCTEADWPFDPAKVGVKPPPDVYAKAAARKVDKKRVAFLHNNADHLMGCLAAGQPFLAAFVLTDRALDPFVTATGALPPTDWFASPNKLGWVGVLAVGYERIGAVGSADLAGAIAFRTGWADPATGVPWGAGGYGEVKLNHLCGSTAGGLVTILKA